MGKGHLFVGTSNIVLPGNKESFPLPYRNRSRLSYYASHFNSLEVNSSFYKLPRAKTLLRWCSEVPAGFRFTIKLSKNITHAKDLAFQEMDIAAFAAILQIPPNQAGCILIQFPAKITFAYRAQAERLIHTLQQRITGWELAIEFRHESWNNAATMSWLASMHATPVLHDKFALHHLSGIPAGDTVYMRFHGPRGDYRGSYAKRYLQSVTKAATNWLAAGKDVYLYFNNTMGDAFLNAKTMFLNAEECQQTL